MIKNIKYVLTASACLGIIYSSSAALADHEPNYIPHEPRAMTYWYSFYSKDAQQADLDYISGMRPHHAGALSMSEDYLANPSASNLSVKELARAIIHNQKYEITVLDRLEELSKNAQPNSYAHIAYSGQAQNLKFIKHPSPPIFSNTYISEEDVRFAKAMIIHHQAAVDMAQKYLANSDANNGYLKLMNLDIITDQKQEIAFMESVITAYHGDSDAVEITPDMIHGMGDMMPHHMKAH